MRMRQPNVIACVLWMSLFANITSRAVDGTSSQDWQFSNSNNPATPTAFTNGAGTASATISPGASASNPPYFDSVLGENGVWDLGVRGQVLLSIPNPRPSGGSNYTDLTVWVGQFVASAQFYPGDLAFSIPGAVFVGRTTNAPAPPPGNGNWVLDEYRWRLTPAPAQISLTITGSAGGTLLDEVRADTLSPGTTVPPLMITSVAKSTQGLAITWSGGLPPYQVYARSNIVGGAGWQAVGSPVSGTGANVSLTGPANFIKVGGSQ
jgi:hypothetical protein